MVERAIARCAVTPDDMGTDTPTEVPTIAFVAKMVAMPPESLPTNRRVLLSAEELRERRRRAKEAEQAAAAAGGDLAAPTGEVRDVSTQSGACRRSVLTKAGRRPGHGGNRRHCPRHRRRMHPRPLRRPRRPPATCSSALRACSPASCARDRRSGCSVHGTTPSRRRSTPRACASAISTCLWAETWRNLTRWAAVTHASLRFSGGDADAGHVVLRSALAIAPARCPPATLSASRA